MKLCLALLAMLLAAAAAGCARPIRTGAIPVDNRPTLTAPEGADADTTLLPDDEAPAAPAPLPDKAVESLRARVVADTLAAREAIDRCAGRKLLPEQEASHDATVGLLMQTRAALMRDDLPRAESLARQARQMSETIGCP